VPTRLNRVVRRGLAFAPEDRYPSMHELLADIRRAVAVQRMLSKKDTMSASTM
jgi:hypothetical protein